VKRSFLVFVLSAILAAPSLAFAQSDTMPEGSDQVETDPLGPFNTRMFWFNRKLDDYFLHPVASGYAKVVPEPARRSVGRFFDNVGVLPRFANNLFQLRFKQAGTEAARFGINSTLGVAGFFDPAEKLFGLHEHEDDFGLTLGHYGVGSGPYLMLPFFGPSTIRDTVGLVADGSMNPMSYLLPWWITLAASGGEDVAYAVNYRSLNLTLFEDVDRYAIDLYGAVQDGYMQRRAAKLKEIKDGS
jgi:phospholipid-binding lipoprotein MlaA